jgi:hypothetical protein
MKFVVYWLGVWQAGQYIQISCKKKGIINDYLALYHPTYFNSNYTQVKRVYGMGSR